MVFIKQHQLVSLSIIAASFHAEVYANSTTRKLTDCDTLKGCYLRDLSTGTEITLTESDSYNISSTNTRGYSVRCAVNGKDGESDFFKFIYNGQVKDEFAEPRWMLGDSGAGAYIVPVPYLASCGQKTINVQGHVWSQMCFEKTYSLTARCDNPSPIAPSATAPLGSAPSGATPTGSAPSGTTPTGRAPSGKAPSGAAPTATAPSGSAPAGSAPLGSAPSGASPTGTAPTGSAPTGTAPTGTAPAGTAPTGAAPSGIAPSGAPPKGSAPSGSAPTGSAPSGSAPSGAVPTVAPISPVSPVAPVATRTPVAPTSPLTSLSPVAPNAPIARTSPSAPAAPAPLVGSITGLHLINAITNDKILDLINGTIVDMDDFPGMKTPSFNINATFSGIVRSVFYWYNSTKHRLEGRAPFTFCGNLGDDFFSCEKLGCGGHTVSLVPYSGAAAKGTEGFPFTVSFSIACTPGSPTKPYTPAPGATPSATSPSATAPSATSPSATSPSATSPPAASPSATSPPASSPSATSPSVPVARPPTATDPSPTSPASPSAPVAIPSAPIAPMAMTPSGPNPPSSPAKPPSTITCKPGYKLVSGCCVLNSCKSDFKCPNNSIRRKDRDCYKSARDCACKSGYKKNIGGQCRKTTVASWCTQGHSFMEIFCQ